LRRKGRSLRKVRSEWIEEIGGGEGGRGSE
jgi:hypothetical protein